MLFSSIPFAFYFLPAVLALYFAVPFRFKNAVLLVFSLVFYAWGEPGYLLLMAVSILLGWLFGLLIGKYRGTARARLFLVLSVAVSLGLLGWFKYADFAVNTLNALGLRLPLPHVALPIGISFYTFQILSYTIDVYRGDALPQRSPVDFGAYVSMFPQLIAGPIVRYSDVARQLKHRTHSLEKASLGVRRLLIGLGKKVLIANQLGQLTVLFRESRQPSVLYVWVYAAAFALQIYFDFSGYSDMAIGLGKIFGFDLLENFNYPFISRSVSEFWRRWHMSLGGWFRDYLYIPLGGNRVSRPRWALNLLVVWSLTGLWHGAAWNFVLWGLLFALLLALEKLWLGRLMEKLPGWLVRIPVLAVLLVSFVLFNADSLSQALSDTAGMFGLGDLPLTSADTLYHLRSYGPLLLLAMVGATPLPRNAVRRLEGSRVLPWLEPVALCALLLAVTAFLVGGSFNPFLYFRF
ncbi:MAG: MBOAT family O-acyltransferase [Clostridiaceae bacterium]|nr:MBOAT family protein [Clostridia bacterium]MDY3871245.1 MBOAT family O-acyltransferase [Clostridiaceae bacterium]